MAKGLLPTFATAPRMTIRVAGETLAMAIGFNVSVSVDVQPVYVISEMRPIGLEPSMYGVVTGTLQIMKIATVAGRTSRATNSIKDKFSGGAAVPSRVTTSDGTLIEPSGATATEITEGGATQLSLTELLKHFTPNAILSSRAFDIEVFTKDAPDVGTDGAVGPIVPNPFMSIRHCRFTSRSINASMGQIVNMPMNFMGLLAVDSLGEQDNGSGIGQDIAIKDT